MSCVILLLWTSYISFLGLGVCMLNVYYTERWYNIFYIYFPLKYNLLSSHPSPSLRVSAVYAHHQVQNLLHGMSKLCIAYERNIS
jgi:hypothetical protein